ncbi:SpoIID/LytB domain-containing protein [Anaerotignum sp.]|uniref:SpoIID/LytB domain-containing protein n=1 Tax=Anaerotignum sp. TaxID=2039241 RepID=UPI00289CA48E|nr:SpoIID/LytB domain-containing protein [Anaerotignum sp.]
MNRNFKKLITAALTLTIGLSTMSQVAFAYDVPQVVRIGLESICKNKATASIGGRELLIGTEKNGSFREEGSISSSTGFTANIASGEYVAIEEEMSQGNASDLADILSRLGQQAYLAYLGNDVWTVYVSSSSVSEVESASRYSATRVNFTGIRLDGSQTSFLFPTDINPAFMGTGEQDTFSINGKSYRGMLTFVMHGGTMTAVNIVDLDMYLYGVVPAEMPASYEMEALKAQTISARTYAMMKISAYRSLGYEFNDTISCQVYNGYSGESARSTQAVNATSGEIAVYNGSPIEAYFSASTGGYTENSENVWANPLPYLRAVPEIAEDGDNSWKVTLTLNDLDALLSAKGENIGSAEDIVITKLSTGGRVQEMKIVGSRGSKTLTKEGIRTYFSAASSGSLPGKMFTINGKGGEIGIYGENGKRSVSGNKTSNTGSGTLAEVAAKNGIVANTEGSLSAMNGRNISISGGSTAGSYVSQSSDYEIYSVDISTVDNSGRFIIEGIGRGHGVGLSQKGAQAMAKLGYKYDEILKYYYTGITIEG